MEPKLASAYIRWSTEDQGEGTSPKIQGEAIQKYCKDHGYTLQEIYLDEGISGWTTKKRPAFLKMKRDAEAGKFQFIIIIDIGRRPAKTS